MNKKIKILILTLLFAVPGIFAQTVEIEKKYNQFQGPVSVSVYMKDFVGASGNVGGITLRIFYNTNVLEYVGVSNKYFPTMEVNFDQTNKMIKINYSSANGSNLSDIKLLDIDFNYQGGSIAHVNFDVDECEIVNIHLGVINAGFENGFVSPSATGYVGKLSFPSTEAFVGSNITLPVQIEELVAGGLSSINSITLKVGYDPSVLQFLDATANGYSFVITGQTTGEVSMNWSSTNSQNMAGPLDLVDLKFKIIGTGDSEVEFLPGTTVTSGTVTQNILMEGGEVFGANARVRVFLQGYYTGSGEMRKARGLDGAILVDQFSGTVADLVTIELHTPGSYDINPYVFNNIKLNQDGYAYFVATGLSGSNFFVTVKHRNHLETVSAAPVSFAISGVTYDFTTAASQAYGNNQHELTDGKFAIFAGDVNQDGFINASDRTLVQTDVLNISTGYLNTDVTGDGLVNAQDRTPVQTNVLNIIARIIP